MNGRKVDDLFGEFTCHRHNGQSTVDYGICSAELLPDISYFKVGDYIPWLSDHTPISHSLMLRESSIQDRKQTTTSKLNKLPPQFHWNSTASEQFTRTLRLSQNKAALEDLYL